AAAGAGAAYALRQQDDAPAAANPPSANNTPTNPAPSASGNSGQSTSQSARGSNSTTSSGNSESWRELLPADTRSRHDNAGSRCRLPVPGQTAPTLRDGQAEAACLSISCPSAGNACSTFSLPCGRSLS